MSDEIEELASDISRNVSDIQKKNHLRRRKHKKVLQYNPTHVRTVFEIITITRN